MGRAVGLAGAPYLTLRGRAWSECAARGRGRYLYRVHRRRRTREWRLFLGPRCHSALTHRRARPTAGMGAVGVRQGKLRHVGIHLLAISAVNTMRTEHAFARWLLGEATSTSARHRHHRFVHRGNSCYKLLNLSSFQVELNAYWQYFYLAGKKTALRYRWDLHVSTYWHDGQWRTDRRSAVE